MKAPAAQTPLAPGDPLSSPPAERFSRTRGCCGCGAVTLVVLAVFGVLLFSYLDKTFSLRSNLTYLEFRNSREGVRIQAADGEWRRLDQTTPEAIEAALARRVKESATGFHWRTLQVKRPARGLRERLVQICSPSEVHILEFDPDHFDFFPWYEQVGERFLPRTQQDALASQHAGRGFRFAINANYYDHQGQPLGWIVRDGKTVRKQWREWSGFFFVKGGKTRFGPRSSLEATPGELKHALQGYPSVMKDGKVWNYVSSNRDQFFNGSELNFRSLAGVGEDGRILFVLSGRGGLLDMAEVTAIARLAGARDATLLDGGRALQYGLESPRGNRSFQAFNNSLSSQLLPKRFAPEKPPVFLIVRDRSE